MNYVEIHIGIKWISNSSVRKEKHFFDLNNKMKNHRVGTFQKTNTKIVRKRG